MNFIVADIGNTFIKICTVDEKTLKIKRTNLIRSDKKINFLKINKIFKKKIRKEVLFASVVPQKFFLLKKYLKNKFDLKATEIKSLNLKQLVKLDIKKPNQVGSDRISNAIGVLKDYSSDSIVIDFGTATTFDVVFKKKIYSGGLIAPGIDLSIKNLAESTALLPVFKIKKTKKIVGKNTIEALRSGFYEGYSGLIDRIIFKIYKHYKKNFKIILTGGYAYLFKKNLSYKVIVDKLLTIKGLVQIYRYNFL
tara:strand:- start:26 stop:778 length:753 start_codon:yes stop_codon:yes gene_type:complete